jgi:hypothetical protein
MTIKDQIQNSDLFLSGKEFRIRQMAAHLGMDAGRVGYVLKQMRGANEIAFANELYRKAEVHWINQMRLANPVEGVNA